jgi:hypothetical protein
MFEYSHNTNYAIYDDMWFLRRCPICSRFVKADEQSNRVDPNATCSKHGRVKMDFIGYFDMESE